MYVTCVCILASMEADRRPGKILVGTESVSGQWQQHWAGRQVTVRWERSLRAGCWPWTPSSEGFCGALVGQECDQSGLSRQWLLEGVVRGGWDGEQHGDQRYRCGLTNPLVLTDTHWYSLSSRPCSRHRGCNRDKLETGFENNGQKIIGHWERKALFDGKGGLWIPHIPECWCQKERFWVAAPIYIPTNNGWVMGI